MSETIPRPISLLPVFPEITPEENVGDSAIRTHALRDGVASLALHMDRCGGTGTCTVAGNLCEGDYVGDDLIPTIPLEEILRCKFDPEPLQERVVPVAIPPTFFDWKEDHVIDDLIGEVLPPEFVKLAKREELFEMYRRSVWIEAPTSESIEKDW